MVFHVRVIFIYFFFLLSQKINEISSQLYSPNRDATYDGYLRNNNGEYASNTRVFLPQNNDIKYPKYNNELFNPQDPNYNNRRLPNPNSRFQYVSKAVCLPIFSYLPPSYRHILCLQGLDPVDNLPGVLGMWRPDLQGKQRPESLSLERDVSVSTSYGLIHGFKVHLYDNPLPESGYRPDQTVIERIQGSVSVFLGIPYALPPVSDARFKVNICYTFDDI